MKTKDITAKEYASYKGCTDQNIGKRIRTGSKLPHVIKIKHFHRFYLLEVPITLNANTFKQVIKSDKKKK